jgi:tripartite-type tricarboxylate transporter receptor subunit TctC
MRALGDELNKRWGQPIIVENRPGGMQNLGARACTEAPPDGYTICILNAEPVAYNQFLLKSMPFDPEKGLQPITNLYHLIQTLVVNASLKVKTIDELIALSKAKPGTLNYVTASVPLAFYMETLVKEKGCRLGARPVQGRRRGGQRGARRLDAYSTYRRGQCNRPDSRRHDDGPGHAQQHPLANFPEVPTLEETGYKGVPSRSWYGLFAPAGTPKPIVDKIAKDVASIVSDPGFRERHLTARSLVPEHAGAVRRGDQADRAAAAQVVKEAGLTPQ